MVGDMLIRAAKLFSSRMSLLQNFKAQNDSGKDCPRWQDNKCHDDVVIRHGLKGASIRLTVEIAIGAKLKYLKYPIFIYLIGCLWLCSTNRVFSNDRTLSKSQSDFNSERKYPNTSSMGYLPSVNML